MSEYAVLATTESDIQNAVAFAGQFNLRLVVKATGHDWYGRSAAAGSLLVWTHLRKNTAWEGPMWAPAGCPDALPVDAVTLQSGVQFQDLYSQAQERGKVVIGGTCDSVGVGGCFLGGCYGTMSKLYGSSASNILQAKVVLANGTLVVANECQNPDLYWSLRGGGAGLGGVVTEFTVRTHRAPAFMVTGGASFWTTNVTAFQALLEQMLVTSVGYQTPAYGGGMGFSRAPTPGGGFTVYINPKGFEVMPEDALAIMQPMLDWAAAQPDVGHSVSWNVWNASTWAPGQDLPWMEVHPDREISTALLESYSKYPTMTQIESPDGVAQMAAAFVNMTLAIPDGVNGIQASIDFEKGQAGASAFALGLFAQTAQNPVIAEAIGILLVMFNIPSLPTIPLNSAVLAVLWPRLQQYAVISESDPLWSVCAAGAAGNETLATSCSEEWLSVRAPALQAQLAAVKATLWEAFPNTDPATGAPLSGSYWNEADYNDPEWQVSHWGSAYYSTLLGVKAAYDPAGLFTCHHCVGSEAWSPDGNCRA